MNLKEKIVSPGEEIATEEEYSSGRNTFTREGKIYSIILGKVELDEENKEANVIGREVNGVEYGDIVIGKVTLVKESTAVIELISAENEKKILGLKIAQLPIRSVSNEYVTTLKKIIKIGDFIKARIVMSNPLAIDLSTKEKGLGVIKAHCSNCRSELNYNNNQMVCLTCGNIEERKWFEKIEEEREFTPRENTSFRGRSGQGFGGNQRNDFGRRNQSDFRGNQRNGFDKNKQGFSGNQRNDFGRRNQSDFGGRENNFRNNKGFNQKPSFGRRNPSEFSGNQRNDFGRRNQSEFGGRENNFRNNRGFNQRNKNRPKQSSSW